MSKSNNVKDNSNVNNDIHAKVGDISHYINLTSTILFFGFVFTLIENETSNFFDKQWKQDGFCVTNIDILYWNSHDLCLYFDTIATFVLAIVYYMLYQTNGMKSANELMYSGIPGVLFHGFGHGGIAYGLREGTDGITATGDATIFDALREKTTQELVLGQLQFFAFWFMLLQASMPNFTYVKVLPFAILSQLFTICFSAKFGFTIVQTILLIAFSINQLARPKIEKDYAYSLYPMVVGIPLTVVGWMESTQCTKFVRDLLYGHLIYDAYIPISMLIFYILCYMNVANEGGDTIKKKKEL